MLSSFWFALNQNAFILRRSLLPQLAVAAGNDHKALGRKAPRQSRLKNTQKCHPNCASSMNYVFLYYIITVIYYYFTVILLLYYYIRSPPIDPTLMAPELTVAITCAKQPCQKADQVIGGPSGTPVQRRTTNQGFFS